MPPRKVNTEPPKPLKPLTLAGIILLTPITLAAFVAGLIGIFILLDEDGSGYFSRTEFAKHYRRLIAWNPFFSAMFFNGGMIGLMFCIGKLMEHFRAPKGAAVASAAQPAAAAAAETKKEQ